jgi:hypothetical protein
MGKIYVVILSSPQGSTQFKRTRDRNVALEIASNARARRWSARIKVVIDGEIAN